MGWGKTLSYHSSLTSGWRDNILKYAPGATLKHAISSVTYLSGIPVQKPLGGPNSLYPVQLLGVSSHVLVPGPSQLCEDSSHVQQDPSSCLCSQTSVTVSWMVRLTSLNTLFLLSLGLGHRGQETGSLTLIYFHPSHLFLRNCRRICSSKMRVLTSEKKDTGCRTWEL